MSELPHIVVRAAAATSAALERREPLEASGRKPETATTVRATSSTVSSSLPNQRPQGARPVQNFTSTGPAKARKSKSLAYPWPSRWRPFAIAVIYLTLVGGGWTSATRWIYPNLVALQPSVTHANPISRPANGEPSISVDEQPGLIRFVKPEYPKSARDRHIQGKVVLNAIVAGNGRVKAVTRLKGDPTLLKAAERAVRGWIYRPYQVNGKPVDINQEIAISFSLPENQP